MNDLRSRIKKSLLSNNSINNEINSIAKELKKCIYSEMIKSYDYIGKDKKPKVYKRTNGLRDSLKFRIENDGNSIKAVVYFDDDLVYSYSGYGTKDIPNNPDIRVHKAKLMDEGYAVNPYVWFWDIPAFGYRAGLHFIEKGIDNFNDTNKWGIKLNKDLAVEDTVQPF